MIRSAGLPPPVRLRAAVHPILQNQYAALTQALFRALGGSRRRGRRRHEAMPELPRGLACARGHRRLLLGRWIADYDDPDNFTFTLLPLRKRPPAQPTSPRRRPTGSSRRRAREARPAGAREPLPEVRAGAARCRDPRAALPRRGLPHREPARSRAPAPQHGPLRQLRRGRQGRGADVRRLRIRQAGGGILHVPIAGARPQPRSLADEHGRAGRGPAEIFETLTWAVEGTRIVPWLASEVRLENEGTRFRFRLQPGRPLSRRPPPDRPGRSPFLRATPANAQSDEPLGCSP